MKILQPPLPKELDAAQALRYMGCTQKADPATEALLQKAEALLRPAAQPHAVWMECPVADLPLQNTGSDLARHLQGCENAVLLAVTLGSGTDRLLQRLSATELPAAVAADAAASTLIEQLCDEIEGELRREYQARGLYITGRYSPGYGDCPLALQSVFAAYLDTGRKIGLTVGSSGLLLPRKSVTAILGISQTPVTGYRAGCAHCVLQKTCQYRKRGVSCEQE